MIKKLIALALVGSLSSCGLYSKYEPQAEVNENLYGAGVAALSAEQGAEDGESDKGEAPLLANIEWMQFFEDATLQSLIAEGLMNNNNLGQAYERVVQAQASFKSSRLLNLPSLSFTPNGSVSGLVDGSAKAMQTYQIPLSTSWQIDLFGKNRNTKQSAEMMLLQSEQSAQAVHSQVVSTIASLYYTISMIDRQLEIAIATEQSWQGSVKTARALKSAGMMNEAGLLQIEAGALGVASSIQDLLKSRKEAENALCSVLGSSPRNIEVSKLQAITLPAEFKLGLPLALLSTRPDVMAAEAALASSFYSKNVARAAFYPQLTLSGQAGWTNNLGNVISNPAAAVYSALAQVVQPIFANGMNRAQYKIAESQLEASRMAFEQTLLDAGIEVNNALISILTTEAKLPLLEQQVSALRRAEKSTLLLMKHGSTTYLEVLSAQQSALSAELSLAQAQFDEINNVISLYSTLGGGRLLVKE